MKDALPSDYVSTTQVAQTLGVSVSTVKRWVEDGILPAHKTAGGHRKLLIADVLELARRNNLPTRDPSWKTDKRGRRAAAPGEPSLTEELHRSLMAGNSEAVRRVIRGAYSAGMSIETLADSVIAPAMHRVGDDWEMGKIDVMHEHRASQLCASALHELKVVLEKRALRERPIAVGGAPEGDFSEIPTLLAQMVLLDAGWNAINLGSNTPMKSLMRAVEEMAPRLIWLSVSHMPPEQTFVRDYDALYRVCEQAGTAVILGGRALHERFRKTLPYTAYGDSLANLAAFARTLLPIRRRPRRGRPTKVR